MKRKLTMMLLCMMVAVTALAQSAISGTVVSAQDGEPIIGAAVKVKGAKQGVVTNLEGQFSINAQAGSTLVFSYVGMKTKEVAAKNGMKVQLQNDDQQLEEVVVTAMGITRSKKSLGYASQDLKEGELSTSGTSSLANAIQGKLTGVDIRQSSGAPGASSQIVIRGARSFDGNNQPLYVIDGMPVTTTADFDTGASVTGSNISDRTIDINPDDIESINVLKGQAASALYGIRASNGVIVITTKRGKAGQSKPQIVLNTNISAQSMSRKFEHQTVYAQGNSVDAYDPTSSMTWGPKIEDLANDATYGGNVANAYTKNGADLHKGQYYNPKRVQAGLDGWTTPEIYDNLYDYLQTGCTENTTLSISQAVNNVNYSFSISNSHQDGIIPSTGMNRWGGRGLVDWTINKEWKTGFSANYSSNRITSAPGANSGIMNVLYSCPAEYNLKGIPYCSPTDPTQQILFRSTSFNNPYWWSANDEFGQHTNRFFGNAYAEFSPNIGLEGFTLKFREQAGIDIWTSDYSIIAEIGSAYNTKGEVENYGSQHNVFNNTFTVNLDGRFGTDDKWGLNVLLGNEINEENTRVWDYDGVNLNFYGFPVISNATSYTASEYTRKERNVGFFGSVAVDWDSQVFLTVTGRNDYVSTMPHGSRSFFYPSVSLGWEFTKLAAFENQDILSYGKLRASYAQVGQAGTYYDSFYYAPSYGGGFYAYTPVSYPLPSGTSAYAPYYVLYDPNLKPQNTTNWEAGLDLAFWNGRIKFSYTYSYQNVKDQIFSVPCDPTSGYLYMMTNAGRMKTNSHEISLNAALVQSKDWDVNLGVNWTKVKNEVVELAEGVESIMLGGFVEPQIRAQAGCTYPNIYGNAFQRTDDGQLLLLEGLPQATANSVDLGNCAPDWTMGLNFSARWKRLSLDTTWSWQKGGKMYHGTNMTMEFFGATKESLPYHEGTMVVDGIDVATGQKNTIEVSKQDYYQAYYNVTESGIYDTSFFKLRDLTLTYDLPKICGIDISVYGFARNILIWAKLPNFDPESSQGNGNMSGYFERFSVPATKSIGGGLKITF
ncbi:MAG: SusC/RagA family TonB-linked outer membrane protein [Prevotella sp.]|nr:SusC/RagA family TonB-linked outer membrane protein [Prevotella sp.]MCI6509824.1 SusC/RagA family TonB-linked outer membrane protein [Prevotella sp.]MCI7452766.1 SusC/RagA family TonB-linked outer membrane protein [Prevotella sp.]MDD7507699.1 SusC/RagA family TonB-linked outer membrane protein [Prevotella sp.]MDY3074553.1 SusC/RagA family TonB-linked outer membrane protein [Prevotella sp.]